MVFDLERSKTRMPICAQCGNKFSGFSFGSKPVTECKNCRKAKIMATVKPASLERPSTLAVPAIQPSTPVVTLTLVAVNLLVYVAMGLSGASWTDPGIGDAVKWGADFGPLTFSGEWWRILTSTFVHFGIIHIAFNMWCLWSLGRALEIFMGRRAFAVTYLLGGLMASMVSIAWNPWRVSAGASGAIFGIAGAFVTYLYLKKVPMERDLVRRKLKDLAIFIGYNLLYGAAGNVDNSAHVGGLVSGLLLGALIPPLLRRFDGAAASPEAIYLPSTDDLAKQESDAKWIAWRIPLTGVIVLLLAGAWVHARYLPAATYGKAVELIRAGQLNQGADKMQLAESMVPNFFLAQALLGELRLEQGNPSAAIPILERASVLVPDAYYIEHNLALAYLGSNRPADASREITPAMKSETENLWRAECILALAAEQSGDSRLAAENLRLVIQSKPDFQEARDALARLDSETKRNDGFAIPYSKLVFKSDAWPLYP
jgi:membrane associated rhomboid family serine protease